MTKILGYENKEIASLYLLSTSIVVVIADLISVTLGTTCYGRGMAAMMLFSYSGWFTFRVTPIGYAKMFGFVPIGYLIVMVFDFPENQEDSDGSGFEKCRINKENKKNWYFGEVHKTPR